MSASFSTDSQYYRQGFIRKMFSQRAVNIRLANTSKRRHRAADSAQRYILQALRPLRRASFLAAIFTLIYAPVPPRSVDSADIANSASHTPNDARYEESARTRPHQQQTIE